MVQGASAWMVFLKKRQYAYFFAAVLISAVAVLLVHFPDYYAYLKTPIGSMYMGKAAFFDPWDINVYVSALAWGQKGHLLLTNLYTTETTGNALIYPLYTVVGYLFSHTNPFLLFHALSTICGFVLCLAIYWLAGYFIENRSLRLIAQFLIIIGGGFGWIFSGALHSADVFATSFTFHSAIQRAHEAIGTLLYLIALVTLLRAVDISRKYLTYFVTASVLLIVFYPYYLLSIGSIGITFFCVQKKPLKYYSTFILGIIVLACVDIVYFIHLNSVGFTTVAMQKLSQINILHIGLGYGLLGFLYSVQLLKNHTKVDSRHIFLNIWIIVSILLNFTPMGINRFFLRGLFFPW